MNLEAMKNAALVERQHKQSTSKTIPTGWGRVVCFDRNGDVIGRVNIPFDQAAAKFEALVVDASTRPTGYGYSLLFGWKAPSARLGYHTYSGTLDVDADSIAALITPNTTKATRTSSKRTK